MRVGIYGRVSTVDKDQNVETQLVPLREFCRDEGWTIVGEFLDHASAQDVAHRIQWRHLLDLAARRKIDLVLVWRLDRAFRSVLDAAVTLERLRSWGVGIRSYSEPWLDTTSPFGEALYYITCAYAQLERGIIAERVKAGMSRAAREGKRIGRPRVTERKGFQKRFKSVLERLRSEELSHRKAAKELGIGHATLLRLLRQQNISHNTDTRPVSAQGRPSADHSP